MNPTIYRGWSMVLLWSLGIGVPAFALSMILIWTGNGKDAFAGFIAGAIMLPTAILWIISNTIVRLYRPVTEGEMIEIANLGTDVERTKIARWSSTPDYVLEHLARHSNPSVYRPAQRNLEARSAQRAN